MLDVSYNDFIIPIKSSLSLSSALVLISLYDFFFVIICWHVSNISCFVCGKPGDDNIISSCG